MHTTQGTELETIKTECKEQQTSWPSREYSGSGRCNIQTGIVMDD